MSFDDSETGSNLSNEDMDDDVEWQEEMAARYPLPLPKPGDVLFKKSTDSDRLWLDAAFSRPKTYIDGYAWAAEILFDHVLKTSEQIKTTKEEIPPLPISHWLVNPIYFLYRHSIELSLKQLLRFQEQQGQLGLSEENKYKLLNSTHDLMGLWTPLRPWLSRTVGDKLRNEIAGFDQLVNEILQQDPNGDAGRYETRKAGKHQLTESFSSLRPLDAENIRETFHKMNNFVTWVWSLMQERGFS